MKSDAIGGYLAILLGVLFVLIGMWFNLSEPPSDLIDCDYGMSTYCSP